jgi:thiopeptide-type bacteriocin biosynthesis protein
LRLHCPSNEHCSALTNVLDQLAAGFDEYGVWRVQVDSYEREVERYGGIEGIQIAEAIFCKDSIATLELLSYLYLDSADSDQYRRLRLAIASADRLLLDFGFKLHERMDIINRLKVRTASHIPTANNLKDVHVEELRRHRRDLLLLLDDHNAPAPIVDRSLACASYIVELQRLSANGKLHRSLSEIVQSLIHMNINRLFSSPNLKEEYKVYDFLTQLYKSIQYLSPEKTSACNMA